jgi:diamine N-acetyltransferase
MLFARRETARACQDEPPPRVLARGEKTVLREFERVDVDRWIEWPRHQDPLFDSYNPPRLSERQRELYYQQYRDSRTSRQYAVDNDAGDLIGRISIREIDWRLNAAVLGISFNPAHLDQGYGTDALRSFLGYYFGTLAMSVLFLDVAAFNQRAYRVYEKCGFRRCSQRWGEPQTDLAGVFRLPKFESVRHLFMWDHGLVRPLLVDMVLRRDEWKRASSQEAAATASVDGH